MNRRIIIAAVVLPSTIKKFQRAADTFGMTHVAISSRLVEWLAVQPEIIQASAVGLLPPDAAFDIPHLLMKQFAAAPTRPFAEASNRSVESHPPLGSAPGPAAAVIGTSDRVGG